MAITGLVFNDYDADGVRDVGEPVLAGSVISATNAPGTVFSGADGTFRVHAPATGAITVTHTPPAGYVTTGATAGGPGVTGLQVGDRVVIANRLTCGQCYYCRRGLDNQCTNYQTIGTTIDGAFAPYLRAPASALFKISPAVPRDDAALFEPLSCVVGAVMRAPIQAGDNVVIIGAGPMGLLFALMYRLLGAGRVIVTDVEPYRLSFARDLGVDATFNPAEVDLAAAIHDLTGYGADVVVDAVGNQMGASMKLSRRGGQIILFGLRIHDNPPVNQYTITRYDLTIHGAFVGLKPFEQTVQLLESGRLQPSALVTHRLPLTELRQGVERAHNIIF